MVYLYVTGVILLWLHLANSLSRFPKVLLISMDGLRYDSISGYTVPNLHRWATQNTWFLRGMRPQYMTMTSTNYMGMVTGLHAESHGIVSNAFYDIDKESGTADFFDYWNYTERPGMNGNARKRSWYTGEPIWITNERASLERHSACIQWPMCDATFPDGWAPTYLSSWTKYQDSREWMDDVDEIIKLFTRNMDPANFVAWYIDEPDRTLHKHGFYDGKYIKILAELDKVFGYLIAQMRRYHLIDEINIILAADHGHAQSFPDYHHFKGHPSRIGDIIIEPEVGYEVDYNCTNDSMNRALDYGAKRLQSSTHGQHPDNFEMHGALLLGGPDIGDAQKTKRIAEVIDLYSLMCFLLDIRPAPNNGSLNRIAKHIHLRGYHPWIWDDDEPYEYMLLLLVSLLIIAIIITICLISLCVILALTRSKGDYDEESSKSSISV
uniref:Bis(5'-adenosyl)-triphosphatase n=1 Tax=Haemonchus contortus TaxID=6289 RepID=A0A7I4YJX1_HAECO